MTTLRWTGREVKTTAGIFSTVRAQIPNFDRKPFSLGAGQQNKHLDTIIKCATDTDMTEVPIATVSKSYSLIQHHDVFDAVERALETLGYDTSEFTAELNLTEFGERMWLKVKFPDGSGFDPGDGHPLSLQLHAINSADQSTRLLLEVGWFRLICANGMTAMIKGDTFQRKHTLSLADEVLKDRIQKAIDATQSEKAQYRRWQEQIVRLETDREILEDWIDNTVSPTWGRLLAARTYNIIRTAHDGDVNWKDMLNPKLKETPHKIRVESENSVPGQQPAENMYDIMNALTWISSHQETLGTRYKQMHQVPRLIDQIRYRVG